MIAPMLVKVLGGGAYGDDGEEEPLLHRQLLFYFLPRRLQSVLQDEKARKYRAAFILWIPAERFKQIVH